MGLTDEHLVGPLGVWAKTLKTVDLADNDLSDAVLQAMIDGGTQPGQLASLNVSQCSRLTGRPLMQLKPKQLNMDGCHLVETTAVDWLRKQGCTVSAKFGLSKADSKRWANRHL